MRYFAKEIPEQAILIMGHPLRFDVLATEDPVLIAELDKCIRKQRGGVTAITKEQHDEELKKKSYATLLQSSSKPLRPHQRQELLPTPIPQDRRAVEVVANPGGRRSGMFARPQIGRDGAALNGRHPEPMPDPIQIPSVAQFAPPPTAKLSDLTK